MSDVALEMASISKSFGATAVLQDVSFAARRGTVHALLGENGAGKTTLMRIAFGMLKPDAGTLRVDNVQRELTSPRDAIAAGVGMVHQHFTLVPAMTVAENIALGGRGAFDRSSARASVLAASARSGLNVDPDAVVRELPVGAQQRVEILKSLARDATILILDEPTAVLTPPEARELLQKTRAFVAAGGTAILITHKLREVLEFADDVTVLRRGRMVWSGRASDTDETRLAAAMLGGGGIMSQPSVEQTNSMTSSTRAPVLALTNVTVVDDVGTQKLIDVTVDVGSGEILGVAAVEGNGQSELLRVLAGRLRPSSGHVSKPPVVGFIPEDRQRDALVGSFTLTENVALLGASTKRGRMNWTTQRGATDCLMREYDVRGSGQNALAESLSGGNQQKLVVAREMEGSRAAIVAENPSRGLDVQATESIHARLRAARASGMAVVVYSTDLDEVLALADRVIVAYEGRVREVALDRDIVGSAMLGVSPE